MEYIKITGGKSLKGEVSVYGAKNAALPILCSSILAKGTHVFHNVPRLTDVLFLCKILEHLGCKTKWIDDRSLQVEVGEIKDHKIPYDLVSKMRASILFLGPMLSREKQVEVSFPGGCAIGVRPVDYHIKAMESLGARLDVIQGNVQAKAETGLKGNQIRFKKASVGATENAMMAACLAQGVTVIENAAKEPEIVDLAKYLKTMGAKISGEGSGIIKITGVGELKAGTHSMMPDRIEAATLLLACAITKGEVLVKNLVSKDIKQLTDLMIQVGLKLDIKEDSIHIKSSSFWKSADIETGFYPAFPTDIQAQWMALMSLAKGKSVISEKVFENRFMHVPELNRMGAHITFHDSYCIVHGVDELKGAQVMATDLRASSSLILAALAAKGESVIQRVYHLDRGYEALDMKLSSLGAQITRHN